MAAAIKSQAPQVPIILITGQHRGAAFDMSPFSAFLAKPFTRTQLLAAVDDVLPLPA
jgi:two-component SAPR family response regulator